MRKIKSVVSIQGECDAIKQAVNQVGLLAEEIPDRDIKLTFKEKFEQVEDFDVLNVGIINTVDDFNNNNIVTNTDFLCLIGISRDKSDEIMKEYGGYVFRFVDNDSCIAFLKGLCYIRDVMDYPDFYLHDAYVSLGHKLEIDKQIEEINLLQRVDFENISGVVAFVFSMNAELRAMYSEKIQQFAYKTMFLPHIHQSDLEFVVSLAFQ